MRSELLPGLLLGLRIIAVHPGFIHCHGNLENPGAVDPESGPKTTNGSSSGDVVFSQNIRHVLGTALGQAQIFGEDPVQRSH